MKENVKIASNLVMPSNVKNVQTFKQPEKEVSLNGNYTKDVTIWVF